MRQLPPLNAVRAFEAAARHESFAKAATELYVTAAAVSQQVKALEAWLEVELFQRLPRGLLLTPVGRAYLPRVSEVLERLAEATEAVRRSGHRGILTVSATPGFTAMWLGPRLWSFATAHPEFDVRVHSSVRQTSFEHDVVDVAIRYGHGGYSGLVSEFLLEDGLTPVCSPRLLEGARPLREPADLRFHTLLHNESAVLAGFPSGWQDWLSAAGVEGVDGQRGVRFNDLHLVMQEAIAGRGVGLGHLALVGEELRSGRLVRPFDFVLSGSGDYYLVYPAGAERIGKVAAFISWLKGEVSGMAAAAATPTWET